MPSPDLPPPRPSRQERFRTDEYRYGTEAIDFLLASVRRLPPGRVLPVAEGGAEPYDPYRTASDQGHPSPA